MNDTQYTPDQAREALAHASRSTSSVRQAGRRHAIYLAIAGLGIGIYTGLSRLLSERLESPLSTSLIAAVFLALWFGFIAWTERRSRAVPRHAKMIGYAGIIGTLVTLMIGLGVINSANQDQLTPIWQVVLFMLWIALPMLIAAALVARRTTQRP